VANGDLISASRAALANDAPELNIARSSQAFSWRQVPSLSLRQWVRTKSALQESATVPLWGRVDSVLGWTVQINSTVYNLMCKAPAFRRPQLWYV